MRVALPDRVVLATLAMLVAAVVALHARETASLQRRHDTVRAGGSDPAPPAVSGAAEPPPVPSPRARRPDPHAR
ncbi:MAG: hypothetical protein RLZZ299_2585 [Pseudomonadota bacterium]|jgi:hypothetical protein